MAEIIWTEPALSDLDAIADYIALENPVAAKELVQRVFEHVDHLAAHPKIGSKLPEYRNWRYRQMIEPPCRIIYRQEKNSVFIVHVMRGEQLLKRKKLHRRRGES